MADEEAVQTDEPQDDDSSAEQTRPRKKRRLLPQTTPGKGSCLVTLFLILLVPTVWLIFLLDTDNVPWRHSMSWTRITLQIVLVAVIPIFVYRAIRSWLETEKSRFPDIDYAWQAGVAALEENGMSLQSAPIFVVIGSRGEALERAIMSAADFDLRVSNVPEGPAPLHWYANPDAIFLFCSETSWLSSLTRAFDDFVAEARSQGATDQEDVPAADLSAVSAAGGETAPEPGEPGGTIMLGDFMQPESQSSPRAAAGSALTPASTIQSDDASWISLSPTSVGGGPLSAGGVSTAALTEDRPALLSSTEITEHMQQFDYVCQLLRQSRQPLCGANGVLTLLPFDMLQAGAWTAAELRDAIRGDLATVQSSLRLSCPVTALVTGMENERGFRELVRRVGRNRSANQRFGSRFEIRSIPTPAELRKFAGHVCGAFEDWVYSLFREQQVLMRPGNTRLFGLLCKVRSTLKNQLGDVLAGSFGFERDRAKGESPQLFSGCYFAATGRTHDRQAFVKAVLSKMLDNQEEVEWTAEAYRDARLVRWLTLAGRLLLVVFLILLLYMIVWNLFTS